jgi:predicted nucleotidyltransferase
MIKDTHHIIETIRNEKTYLQTRYFIAHLDLYGSYAKKQQKPGSDIDILYTTIPNGDMTLARLKSIETYLSGLLQIEKIELVSSKSVNPVIAKDIEKYAISIF